MQIEVDGLVYTISNIIQFFILFVSTDLLLKRRLSLAITLLVYCIGVPGFFLIGLLPDSLMHVRIFLGVIWFCAIVSLLHTDSLPRKLLTASLVYGSMLLGEVLTVMFVPRELVTSQELYIKHAISIQALYLLVVFLSLSFVVSLMLGFKKHSVSLGTDKQWFLFPLFPLSQCLLLSSWFSSYLESDYILSPQRVIPTVAVCLIADIALVFALTLTARNTEMRERNHYLEEQISFEQVFYTEISRSLEENRRLRHDIDNHLYTIQALIEQGNAEQSKEYASELLRKTENDLRYAGCRHPAAAAYLKEKAAELEAAGIRLDMELDIPAGLTVSNPDLICLLGNLLDNAQEAVKDLPEPVIRLAVHWQAPYLHLFVANPLPEDYGKSNKKQRIEGLRRGLGLSILEHLADQYDGDCQVSVENGLYRTDILIKGQAE